MVSPLKWKRTDPMNKKRGSGFYYKRSYKGDTNWWSKYSGERDGQRKVSLTTKVTPRYAHSGDMSITKRRHVPAPTKSGRSKRKLFGWF